MLQQLPLFCIITNCKNLIFNATTDKCFFFKVSLPKDAGWTLFLFDLIREPHWKFCGSTTRDSAHAQNGECGYAGSSQSPKRLKKAKTPRKLWKERDVTLAPRNVECDDIRIFSARWPTKVLPQFPLWSVVKDFLSKLKFQTWLIFSRWKADVIYTTSCSYCGSCFGNSQVCWLVGQYGLVLYGMAWCGVVWSVGQYGHHHPRLNPLTQRMQTIACLRSVLASSDKIFHTN